MKLVRNGLVGAAIALVFFVGGTATAGAHPSQGSSVAGAAGWLDHAGVVGDGVYSYALADTNTSDGKCAILQVTWGTQSWYTQAYTCTSTPASGTFPAPAGGVFFQVCAFSVGSTQCGPIRPYWDNH
jgi:hypothetical protein